MNKLFKRAGVLPYTIDENYRVHFLFGIDKISSELTDFGGGCKKNESLVDTAFREFSEETCFIFANEIRKVNLCQSTVLYNGKNNVLFLMYVRNEWLEIAEQKFDAMRVTCSNSYCLENIRIKWIPEQDFYNYVYNDSAAVTTAVTTATTVTKVWSLIKHLINTTMDYESLLLSLFSVLLKPSYKTEKYGQYII
jgi:hypothetical protein